MYILLFAYLLSFSLDTAAEIDERNELPRLRGVMIKPDSFTSEVLGERNDEWEVFRKDVEYESFLVRRKK